MIVLIAEVHHLHSILNMLRSLTNFNCIMRSITSLNHILTKIQPQNASLGQVGGIHKACRLDFGAWRVADSQLS